MACPGRPFRLRVLNAFGLRDLSRSRTTSLRSTFGGNSGEFQSAALRLWRSAGQVNVGTVDVHRYLRMASGVDTRRSNGIPGEDAYGNIKIALIPSLLPLVDLAELPIRFMPQFQMTRPPAYIRRAPAG